MSRYLILLLLNLPFILLGFTNTLVSFKTGHSSRRRFLVQTLFWVIIFAGLAMAEPLYLYLFNRGLTDTESLSLFDVIQITGIVFVFYIANRSRNKLEVLEKRVQDLHQELSIQLSVGSKKK